MTKKIVKKSTSFPQIQNFFDFDKVFENFRKDLEKSFLSFPRVEVPSFPKLPEAACDVIDEGNHLQVKMNIPGITKKDIHLNVTENALEVHAEHKEESEKKAKNYLQRERNEVSLSRIVPLPEKIVTGKVRSKLIDGVLEITLPKLKPSSIPKKRSIKIE